MSSVTLAKVPVYPCLESKDACRIKERKILGDQGLVGSNATSSLRDEALSSHRKSHLTIAEKQELKNWDFILNKSRDAIEHHLDKRISQLFVQAVLCYNTDYTFREGHTLHQGFGAHHLEEVKFNSAHHATIPCVFGLSKSTKKEIVFLYRSGFYDESNATVDIIKQSNDADRAIDEKTNTSLLRTKTIALLNKAASAELTPPQVVKLFVKKLLKEIDKAILKEKDQVVDVLKIYRSLAEDLVDYVDTPENIDRWLNLQLDDPILFDQKITNRELIKRKINDLTIVIHNERHQKTNESHIPSHFHDLYRHKVLSQFEGKELEIIENAMGVTFKDLDENVQAFINTGRTNSLIKKHAKKIDQLKTELMPLLMERQNQPAKKEHLTLSASKKICLRPSLYRLRYQMIALDQIVQSKIKSHLESTLNKVKNGSRATHFDDFFVYSVLKEIQTESDRLIVCKLLNLSPLTLEQKIREVKVNQHANNAIKKCANDLSNISDKIREGTHSKTELKDKIKDVIQQISSSTNVIALTNLCYRRLYDRAETPAENKLLEKLIRSKKEVDAWIENHTSVTKAEQLLSHKTKKIKKVASATLKEIEEIMKKTKKFQSDLLLELRQASGMTQKHFINEYNKKFSTCLNNSQLIDFEKGRLSIPIEMIKRVAKFYGVSQTLFFPSHFAE